MINRKYKDTVFRMLFGSPEYKENTLALYNAMNGSHYEDPACLEITTISDVIYMSVKNDTSFIVGDELSLWEHQSSYNPNMPLRGLSYFARLYEKYVQKQQLNYLGNRLLSLPTPRYVVFYNGEDKKDDVAQLRLSDSFSGEAPAVEVTATMVNINYGHNQTLMQACQALSEYAYLVHGIRKRKKEGLSLETAVQQTIDECITKGILHDFLLNHKAEVSDMFLTEYDEDSVREMMRRDAYEEGAAEGRRAALKEAAEKLVKELGISREKAEAILGK